MSKKEIKDFIKQQKITGDSKAHIRQSLLAIGHPEKLIDLMLASEFTDTQGTRMILPSEIKPGEKPPLPDLSKEDSDFVKTWSVGAFFGSWVWAFGNKLPGWGIAILLLSVIPIVGVLGFGLTLYLTFKGRELAWAKGWPNIQAFRERQSLMAKIILVVIIASTAVALLLAFTVYGGINNL